MKEGCYFIDVSLMVGILSILIGKRTYLVMPIDGTRREFMNDKCRRNIHANKLPQYFSGSIGVIILSIIFFIFPVSSYAESNTAVDRYYDYAMKLQQNGLHDQAEEVLNAGIKKYPQATKLFYARGNLRNEYLHQYLEAVQDYTAVIRLDLKNNPKALYRRGDCLYALGAYQQSIADYSHCLKLLPGYDKVYFKRAKAYAKLGMIDNAKKDLISAVKFNPKYEPEARALLGQILSGNNNY